MRLATVFVGAIVICGGRTSAQQALTQPLTADITALDDSLSAAFNSHDIHALMALFAGDLEFYHDIQGLQNYQAVSAGFQTLFGTSRDIRRERVGPLEVYPLPNFGAIEVGAHRFCHTAGGRQDCGTFKFVHVWRHDISGWKIARVVSYGH